METAETVEDLLRSVEPPRRRTDADVLLPVFQSATGFAPRVFRPGVIGFGTYDYVYDSGHSGTSFATGFAPRKANMVVYIMPGYSNFDPILERLGKHRKGKACLYLGALSGVDLDVLGELVKAGLDDLSTRWAIKPT